MSYHIVLQRELQWLEKCIDMRMAMHKAKQDAQVTFELPPKIESDTSESAYAKFITAHELDPVERLLLVLALVPHINPALMDKLLDEGKLATTFLINSASKAALLPTAETFIFLVAGQRIEDRLKAHALFDTDHVFYKKGVIDVRHKANSGSQYDGELRLNQDYVDSFLFNRIRRPKYSPEFPAHLLHTELTWDDLVLNPVTEDKINEMKDALEYRHVLVDEWGLGAHIKPGYRAIFYGPSGTGKSLTATLLGKTLNRDVYRIDLSAVISKYIGETEENISKLLNKSEDKGYILFFDEGDALFGSRAQDAQNSNDHHHNQLIAYLLQAIENFNGIIILATNMKANLDDAFSRRFQTSIFFGPPKPEQGFMIWQRLWPKQLEADRTLDFKMLVTSKPFTAAMIVQIIQVLSLKALRTGKHKVGMMDIKKAVEELAKK